MRKSIFTAEEREPTNGWRDLGPSQIGYGCVARAYAKGPCRVLVSREDHGNKMRWHLSISHPDRYPGWNEIKDARYSLLPHELTFAQILPPPENYTNIHRNCFHLWEIEDGEW